MSVYEEWAESLRGVLRDERAAIVRLDSEAVNRATSAKESLLATLLERAPAARTPYLELLAPLRADLERNMVLLAHAREAMRETVAELKADRGRVRIQL